MNYRLFIKQGLRIKNRVQARYNRWTKLGIVEWRENQLKIKFMLTIK